MSKENTTESKAPVETQSEKPPIEFEESVEGSLTGNLHSLAGYKAMFGVEKLESANGLMTSLLTSLGNEGKAYRVFAISLLTELEPRDPMEGMLVSQLCATHVAVAAFSQRMLNATNPNLREGYERSLSRLQRTFVAQLAALKKYRELPQHKVQVGHVTVNEGGQAIVGSV